jgi:thioredoxin 1
MVKTITTDNFSTDVLNAGQLALVDFWATWCGPCRMMGPVVEEVAEDFGDKIVVGKLNVDENRDLAVSYNVLSIPTLIFFQNGAEKDRVVGAQNKAALTEKINQLM